ncbi:phage protein GemA/Gp16 family protein [Pseudogemmobacter sonorensis]|uniref:phage protein GemA/Gp16 family protein n=1 Tax=Pseudogemmobacter sonorensis TaxID=2989681 RepID=UPI0036C6C3E7
MTAANLRKMIHTACRQLGLDEDARRGLQVVATGKASMSDMSESDLRKVVEALKKRGFEPFGNSYFKRGQKPAQGRAKPLAPRADLRLIHVMWKLLGEAGAIDKPGRAGLNAFIRARFENTWKSVPIDIDVMRDHGQIDDVVQALKAMCRRAGVRLK